MIPERNYVRPVVEPPIQTLADEIRRLAASAGSPTIYMASKTAHAPKWRQLRAHGLNIIATWIDEAGEGQSADYAELAQRCIEEASAADVTILYCREGEILKGALLEAGAALAAGKEVRCVGDCESISRVFRRHPLWIEYSTLAASLANKKPVKEMNSITITTPMRTDTIGMETISLPEKIYTVVRDGDRKPLKNLSRWCAALRSGEYTQGNGMLRSRDDKYCCLGVLCEVSEIKPEISDTGTRYIYDYCDMVLPESLRSKSLSGVGDLDCTIARPDGITNGKIDLIYLNDKLRFSFGNIADVLELLYYDEQETSEQQ